MNPFKLNLLLLFLSLCACTQQSEKDKTQEKLFKFDKKACTSNLIYVTEKNLFNKAKILIDSGCNVNGKKSDRNGGFLSPLVYSVYSKDNRFTKLFLSAGADPNLDLGDRGTPMLYAGGGNAESLKLLIEKGGDVNTLCNKCTSLPTPLLRAIDLGTAENVRLLVENGALVNYDTINKGALRTSWSLESPLHMAMRSMDIEKVRILLSNGANPSLQVSRIAGDCVTCPFDIAPIHDLADASSTKSNFNFSQHANFYATSIELLKAHGADLNIKNRFGKNALEYILYEGNEEVANVLIKNGVSYTDTTFYEAVRNKNFGIAKVLLANGAKPNSQILKMAKKSEYQKLKKLLEDFGYNDI